jgi:hypothetical protein
LTSDERQLLAVIPTSSDAVIEKLSHILEELEKKSKRPKGVQRANQFFSTFCQVVGKTSGLVNTLLPQSPEYTIPFGMLIILFKVWSD